MESSNNLKKRLYQNLINKAPKQNSLLGSTPHTRSAILKPKINQQIMNSTVKMSSPGFQKGKIKLESLMKSPQIPKKIAPIAVQQKLSKQGKAVIEQGKFKSKANLKPHDIFAFYQAFPQMVQDFFYLNRIGHPYDYQIVTYSQRNPLEYMTISSKGVTLYHQKQAEFMTKDQWLADQKIYFSLQKIQFFRQYKITKNFTIWKNRMRRHYMKEMSNLLSESLFFSFEHPRHCLLQIRKITNHLKQSNYFMPSDSIQSMDANLFLQNALHYIDTTFMAKIREVQNLIADQLELAINEQIKKFKLQNNIKIKQVGDHDKKQQKQGYVYSQEAILRKEYKKVHKLIKLADNMLLETKIQLVHKSILQLLDKLQETKSEGSKEEWINCTALPVAEDQYIKSTSQKRIIWNPTVQGLKQIFKSIISQTVNKMNQKYQKISSRDKFQKFRAHQQNQNRKDEKRNTLKYMVEDSSFYGPLVRKIQIYLQEEFRRTQLQQSELIKFIDVYTKHKSLPAIKQLFSLHSASECCQFVRQWKQDNQDMQLLPDNKSAGLLVFNYSELRKKMISAPSQTLTSFLAVLPEQTSSRCRNLLHQSKNLLQMINNYPTDIASFVTFNKAVRIASQRLDTLVDEGKQVIQLVTLIEQNKLANIDIYKGRSKQVMVSINNLKLKVDQSNAKYDQSLSKFRKQLQANTIHSKSAVKQFISKFEVIPFDSITSQIIPTLQKLQEILPSIKQLEDKAVQIQQIQSELSLPLTQLNQIHLLYNKSKVINELWQCKKEWNQLLIEIYNKHYKQIDCEQLRGKWQNFSTKNNKLHKSLPDNEVLKKLMGQICEFQNLLETIAALTSPNLQEKSWREISQYLAYELNIDDERYLPFSNRDDPEYTVEWLITNNISLYKQKISFIVQKSEKQKQLQNNLGEFRSFISGVTFDTVVKKRQVPLIQKNETLQINLKQKIQVLYSLIGNQYSEALQYEAEVMIKHYEYMQEILQSLYTFRKDWQKYELFFQNNAVCSKLLTKQAKQFGSWEIQWKKIIKNIINDPTYFYRKICDQTMGLNCSRAIIKSMNKANMFLDLVKKGMQQFLQKKRLQYPRYCLFTDQELLQILSKLDNKNLIVPEIVPTLFDNIKSIEYVDESGIVTSVTTADDQKLLLIKQSTFKSQSQMQDVLKITEEQIKKTMAHNIRTAFNKYVEEETSREQLIRENNLQVALTVDYIAWVRLAEETYLVNEPVGSMQDWLTIQQQQIKQVLNLMKNCPESEHFKYLQFILQSLYFKEKTVYLAKSKVSNTQSYEWQRIPKMIMTNSEILLKQLESRVFYNYELLNQKDCVIIQAETQRVWVNLINAISSRSVIGLKNSYSGAVKDLAFYVGQSIEQIKISQQCNVKTVQRLLTGYMYLGCWMHFLPIKNPQILSFLAYHISSSKRVNSFESTSTALQLTKSTMFSNSMSNAVFLFEAGQNLVQHNLIDPKNFRNVSLQKPDQIHIVRLICQAENIPQQIGTMLTILCDFCKQTFTFSHSITSQCKRQILNYIKKSYLSKISSEQQLDNDVLKYIVLSAVEQKFSIHFSTADTQIFQSFKTAFLPNYLILRSKLNHNFSKEIKTHPVNDHIKSLAGLNYTKQFTNSAIKLYDMLVNNDKLGVFISGPILSGKSKLLEFVQEIYRQNKQNKNQSLQVFKLYPNSYKFTDILKSNTQQKKQKKQKTQKSQKNEKQKIQKFNEQFGIIQTFLKSQSLQKWIILDGKLDNNLIQLTNDRFDNLLVPNYGLVSTQKFGKVGLQTVKIIVQTLNSSELSPSMFYNYGVCHVSSQTNTIESLINSFLLKNNTKHQLKSLSQDSISYLKSQLISNLVKIEQKGNIKTKSLQFLYPFSQNQITIKSLKLIECVFRMNHESIRQKQKHMKKTIEKFVCWAILMVLYLHVEVQNQVKLQKKFMEICKCENLYNDSIIKYIVYPGSGIEVHPVNGLRTQSSIFQIPEKGIITLTPKNDCNDFNNSINKKTNKFYEQISLEDISCIRVNNQESNIFSYYSQLFAYCNQPVVLYGSVGSGKKSILELYGKNIRQRSFVHSIRHHSSKNLMQTYEKPYRKYNSLQGVVLKSYSINKNIVVFVEDLNMVKYESFTLEFLRMLATDNKFINKNGQTRKLKQENNSLTISTSRIDIQENVLRTFARMSFFQVSKVSSQKISSIYLPYLKAWGKANSLQGQTQRIFCSEHGDNILDASIKVFELMQEMYKNKKAEQNYSFETVLLKPRLGDIGKVLAFICRTQNASKHSLSYYSQLWANEILRVFDDRLSPCQKDISDNLMQLMKKQFFLKFKQNFLYTSKDSLIFTNILSQQNSSYDRIQDMQNLQQLIINQIQSQTVTVPVKLFFNELLRQVMKIYRIIELDNGHMILLNLNKKVRKYLIELACQISESNFISLNKNIISAEKDIITTLDLDQNVIIFQDIDDVTVQQIYQFTCMLNKNFYDYELTTQTKQKIKNRLSKYMKSMFNQLNSSNANSSTSQKSKAQLLKEKENIYLNQKLQDELEITMQQIFMNNVHFILGASPVNKKSKQFLLNQTDLVGQMHYSFFHIPDQSLLQISKQILTIEEQPISDSQSQQTIITEQNKKIKQQTAQSILKKCTTIYKSLNQESQNFNQLLCICENIMNQKQKIQKQSKRKVQELEKCIQNHQKAISLIAQNQQKIKFSQIQLQNIKKEQSIFSQKLEEVGNSINDLQLSVTETNDPNQQSTDQIEKAQKLKFKNQQFLKLQNQLREIKMKKDKNDLEVRQARKIIQLSKDFLLIVQDISTVQKKLQEQKIVLQNSENLLILWWSIVTFQGNKQVNQIIKDINKWKIAIEFKNNKPIQNPSQVLGMFSSIIAPLDNDIPGWQSLSCQNKLKGVMFIYTLMHQEFTISSNKIITLYDPSKIYSLVFKHLSLDAQLGDYSFGNVIKKFDQTFWAQIQKSKKGLIFLQQQIDSRQKKQIEKSVMQRRYLQLNRFVSLVSNQQNADFCFNFEKKHFLNYLKLISLIQNEESHLQSLMQIREENMKSTKRLKQLQTTFRNKCALINFHPQSDTEEMNRIKREIIDLEQKNIFQKQKLKISNLHVKDEQIIEKIIEGVFKHLTECGIDTQKLSIQMIVKIYKIITQKIKRFIFEVRQDMKQIEEVIPQTTNDETSSNTNIVQNPILKQINSTVSQTTQIQKKPQNTAQYSAQELQLIFQLIQRVLSNNFNKNQHVYGDDIFSLDIFSQQLKGKVPIVIVQNNLINYNYINKDNRPINLLYNTLSSFQASSSNDDKNNSTINKIFLFYNDQIHYLAILDLINKFSEEYHSTTAEKKHCVYLFTNAPLSLLTQNQLNSNYQLFFYHKLNKLNMETSLSQKNIENFVNLNQNSTKIQLYSHIVQSLTGQKFYNNISQLQRYASSLQKNQTQLPEESSNKNTTQQSCNKQLKKFMIDTFDKIQNQDAIIQKVLNGQITFQLIKQMNQNFDKSIDCCEKSQQKPTQDKNFQTTLNISKEQIQQIQEQLPYIFNTAQFLQLPSKDCLCVQIQNLSKIYNKKIKKVKNLLEQNLKQQSLSLNKIINCNYQSINEEYLIPTGEYIRKLNHQYKTLKKLLTQSGMLIGPSPSMAKIVSSKGISSQFQSQANIMFKNSLSLSDLYFNPRIFNEFKIRISKKLKIPYNRVGFIWIIEKKIQNSMNIAYQRIINALSADILMSVNGVMQNGELKVSSGNSKQEKQSHKLLKIIKNGSNKKLKLLLLPYDLNIQNSQTDLHTTICNTVLPEIMSIGMGAKKRTFCENSPKKQQSVKQKNINSQNIKIKIVFNCEGGQMLEMGHIEMPSSEIDLENQEISTPVITISQKV